MLKSHNSGHATEGVVGWITQTAEQISMQDGSRAQKGPH